MRREVYKDENGYLRFKDNKELVDKYIVQKELRNRETYKDDNGYCRFYDTKELVHRWVVEMELGHKLPPRAVVHHRNGKKWDNRLCNLKVYKSQGEHDRTHWRFVL